MLQKVSEICNTVLELNRILKTRRLKIVKILKGQEERIQKKTAGVMMSRKGVIAAICDLMTSMDWVQRLNTEACKVLAQKWLKLRKNNFNDTNRLPKYSA